MYPGPGGTPTPPLAGEPVDISVELFGELYVAGDGRSLTFCGKLFWGKEEEWFSISVTFRIKSRMVIFIDGQETGQ